MCTLVALQPFLGLGVRFLPVFVCLLFRLLARPHPSVRPSVCLLPRPNFGSLFVFGFTRRKFVDLFSNSVHLNFFFSFCQHFCHPFISPSSSTVSSFICILTNFLSVCVCVLTFGQILILFIDLFVNFHQKLSLVLFFSNEKFLISCFSVEKLMFFSAHFAIPLPFHIHFIFRLLSGLF